MSMFSCNSNQIHIYQCAFSNRGNKRHGLDTATSNWKITRHQNIRNKSDEESSKVKGSKGQKLPRNAAFQTQPNGIAIVETNVNGTFWNIFSGPINPPSSVLSATAWWVCSWRSPWALVNRWLVAISRSMHLIGLALKRGREREPTNDSLTVRMMISKGSDLDQCTALSLKCS